MSKATVSIHRRYDESFYDEQFAGSLASARVLLGHLAALMQPASVVDLGCGRGAWLSVWAEMGVPLLVGIDGSWKPIRRTSVKT